MHALSTSTTDQEGITSVEETVEGTSTIVGEESIASANIIRNDNRNSASVEPNLDSPIQDLITNLRALKVRINPFSSFSILLKRRYRLRNPRPTSHTGPAFGLPS
jgi:hypothetical protein